MYMHPEWADLFPGEGGLSACAEAGFSLTPSKFTAFIQRLRSIHPRSGTSYSVELTAACKPIEPVQPLVCGGIEGTQCPDAQQYCDFSAPGVRSGECTKDLQAQTPNMPGHISTRLRLRRQDLSQRL